MTCLQCLALAAACHPAVSQSMLHTAPVLRAPWVRTGLRRLQQMVERPPGHLAAGVAGASVEPAARVRGGLYELLIEVPLIAYGWVRRLQRARRGRAVIQVPLVS